PAYEQVQRNPVESAQVDSIMENSGDAANDSTAAASGRAEQASFESPPRPLQPPGEAKRLPKPDSVATDGRPASGLPSMLTVFGSLLVVLAAFFAITWFMRRGLPNRLAALPTEVVEVLGRSTLATRNQMHLIRVGNKLLLVSVTPTGAETLTEITDPAEVDRLGAICSQQQANGIAQSFRGVLEQLNRDAESGDSLGTGDSAATSRRGLFARRPHKDTNHDA
ncbi:MAG: flagellar biosynthetic protein FliO, partial [Pirellulales bacterium]